MTHSQGSNPRSSALNSNTLTIRPQRTQYILCYELMQSNISVLFYALRYTSSPVITNRYGSTVNNTTLNDFRFSTFSKEFCWPYRAKGIIGRDLKFAGYVLHCKILTVNIFGLILKNKMATMGISLSVTKSAYISLIIGPRVLVCEANL